MATEKEWKLDLWQNYRRLKAFLLTREALTDMVQGKSFRFDGGPSDAFIRNISYDFRRDCLVVLIQSATFDVVPEGFDIEIVPLSVITIEKEKADGN